MASAKIDKEIEQFKLEKNKKLLELDIQRTKLNREVAFESIRITTDALMQSDENLKVSNDNYVVGMGNLTDLLIAQTEWQKAYNNLIDSKTDYKIKETEYLRATGNLNNK
jgi:outer membrane protein TolC